jgi:hypothetical protein
MALGQAKYVELKKIALSRAAGSFVGTDAKKYPLPFPGAAVASLLAVVTEYRDKLQAALDEVEPRFRSEVTKKFMRLGRSSMDWTDADATNERAIQRWWRELGDAVVSLDASVSMGPDHPILGALEAVGVAWLAIPGDVWGGIKKGAAKVATFGLGAIALAALAALFLMHGEKE